MEYGKTLAIILFFVGISIFVGSIIVYSIVGIILGFLIGYIHPLISIILKIEKKRQEFFSDYADHSKEIAKILKIGYGNEDILGSITDFDIVDPKKPKIEDIGKANIHLEKDYPEVWVKKEKAFFSAKESLTQVKETIEQFDRRVKNIIDKESDYRPHSNNSLQELLENKYYYSNISLEIFREIQRNSASKLGYDTQGNFPNIVVLVKFESMINTIFSFRFDSESSKVEEIEIQRIIKTLKEDVELKLLIKSYQDEYNRFYNNDERTSFFNAINQLYSDSVYENKSMNKKGRCGSKNCMTRFTKLRYLFPE